VHTPEIISLSSAISAKCCWWSIILDTSGSRKCRRLLLTCTESGPLFDWLFVNCFCNWFHSSTICLRYFCNNSSENNKGFLDELKLLTKYGHGKSVFKIYWRWHVWYAFRRLFVQNSYKCPLCLVLDKWIYRVTQWNLFRELEHQTEREAMILSHDILTPPTVNSWSTGKF